MVFRITAEELNERLNDAKQGDDDSGRPYTLVDTRQPESFDGWHIYDAENIPYDPTQGFDEEHREAVEDVANGDPVIAICGKGLTSTSFGVQLDDDGYGDVTVVEGGMEAWATVQKTIPVTDADSHEAGGLVVEQLQRRATGCLGYLVGDRDAGEAVVVDPTRQTDDFAVAAEREGMTITAVIDTHVHADHLSGGPQLAAELGVPYRVGVNLDDPEVEHSYESLEDGQTLLVGDIELQVIHAPGHTAEMVNLVVDGEYLLTADTLHVDSVGRTELGFGEDEAEEGAALLYESIHDRLLELDGELTVLPGHVSVTEDNRYQSGEPGEPIRKELSAIESGVDRLGLDREAFVAELTEDLPEKPDEYETVIAINVGDESVETEEEAAELETGPNSCSA